MAGIEERARLTGKVAIATGGRGGSGAAAARVLAGEGAHIVIGYIWPTPSAKRAIDRGTWSRQLPPPRHRIN